MREARKGEESCVWFLEESDSRATIKGGGRVKEGDQSDIWRAPMCYGFLEAWQEEEEEECSGR